MFYNGLCYQSYDWMFLRPLGNLQNAVNHLDEYKIDEISIIRPVRTIDSCLKGDIESLKRLKSSTPIAFGGGIRSLSDIDLLEGLPIERVIVSSVLFEKKIDVIDKLTDLYGKQALVGYIPFKNSNKIEVFNSSKNKFCDLSTLNLIALKNCDEIVLHDCNSEGSETGFSFEVIGAFNIENIILSGGVAGELKKIKKLDPHPKSVLIENKVLHFENSKMSLYGKV